MPKDRRSPQDGSVEPTFDDWLTLVESLKNLKASEKELALIAGEWAKPGRSNRIATEANQLGASLTKSASGRSGWTGEILVLLVCGYFDLQRGLDSFLPARCSRLTHRDRLALLLELLALRMADPWPAVRLVVWLEVLGPHAVQELMSRCDQHVGTMYAAVPGFPEAELPSLLLHLCKLSLNQKVRKQKSGIGKSGKKMGFLLDETTRAAIIRALNGGTLGVSRRRALDRMHGALHKVLGRRILVDPLRGMVQALDGRYNKNPEFVAWQQVRDRLGENQPVFQYPPPKYRSVEVTFDSGDDNTDIDGLPPKDPSPNARLPVSGALNPELDRLQPSPANYLDYLAQEELAARDEARTRAFQEAVDTLCAGSARHRLGWRALKGEPLETLAVEARRRRQAIARYRNKFEDELLKLLKDKNKHLFS